MLDTIPICFCLATSAALISIMLARVRGKEIDAFARIPFGVFLCPALWLVFYAGSLFA